MVGLEHFTYDLQVKDLANFVRKMMEKNDWNPMLGKMLIEEYQKERALLPQEKRCLYLMLAYPEKFWKLANHYHSAHKTWLSERNVEKLKTLILQENEREQFLQEISGLKG